MSDQKNIDNLFREKFKDFEATPDPALWDKISSKLDEKDPQADKKKKEVVFLPWLYRIAGIAAALLLLFAVGSQFFGDKNNVLDPENQTTSTTKEDTENNATNKNNTTIESTSATQITNSETDSKQEHLQNNNTSQQTLPQQKEQIANEHNNAIDTNTKNGVEKSIQKGSALQNAVATQENGTKSNTASQQFPNSTHTNNANGSNRIQTNATISTENAVANTNSSNTTINNASTNKNANGNPDQNNIVTKNDVFNNKNVVAENKTNSSNTTKEGINNSTTDKIKNTNETAITAVTENGKTNNNIKTANSATEESSTTELDTTKEAIAETKESKEEIKKSLLDVINELHELDKDSTAIAEANTKRWTISPNASPVYYNTMVNGSPIAETFADNAKTGDVNLSFGVNVGYDVSKRLTVRAGIHKVDYSYSTQDVAIVPSINTGPGTLTAGGFNTNGDISNDITTIAFNQNASTFSLRDKQAPINGEFSPTVLDTSIRQAQIEGNLNQRMSYIEVPVEVKYALIDKKIGVNVIGGVSTLVLTENSLVLDSPALTTELGEATNINDLSFSTNIGIGIDYKLSKQLEFNLEPMLKYQLNTFSGNTGNFKPYSVGVYTGVSFRF